MDRAGDVEDYQKVLPEGGKEERRRGVPTGVM